MSDVTPSASVDVHPWTVSRIALLGPDWGMPPVVAGPLRFCPLDQSSMASPMASWIIESRSLPGRGPRSRTSSL